LLLAEQGVKIRDICRKMDVSRNTVRNVIRHPELKPVHEHDAQSLIWIREAFSSCRGNAVRIAEIIREEKGAVSLFPGSGFAGEESIAVGMPVSRHPPSQIRTCKNYLIRLLPQVI